MRRERTTHPNTSHVTVDHVRARADWSDALESWCRYLEAIGRTRQTIRTRWYQISRFSRMVGKPIGQVTSMDVVNAVSDPGLGLSARKGLRAAIQGFYQWAIDVEGTLGARTNPARAVPPMPDAPGGGLICPEDALARAVTHQDPRVRVVCMLAGWLVCSSKLCSALWSLVFRTCGGGFRIGGRYRTAGLVIWS